MLTTYHSNFIGGTWVDSVDGRTDAVIDPATGEPMAEVAASSAADVDRAFDEWAGASPATRAAALLRFADAVEADGDELVRIESQNVGKPIAVTPPEVDFLVDNLRFFAGAARVVATQAPGEYLAGHTSVLRREPLGVAGLIAPWNYPMMMAGWRVGPAL